MNSLENARSRLELLVLGANGEPCGAAHAFRGVEQCSQCVRETTLYCLHGHDTVIHEFITALESEGSIDADEACRLRIQLEKIRDELAKEDLEAECLGADDAPPEEVAPYQAALKMRQRSCVERKLTTIARLRSLDASAHGTANRLSSRHHRTTKFPNFPESPLSS